MRQAAGKNAVLAAAVVGVALVAASRARAVTTVGNATGSLGRSVTIMVGSARGSPGATVLVDVILAMSTGEMVAGTQNDITFDPDLVNLAGASACRINPAISDDAPGCEDDPNSGPCKMLNRSLADVEGGRRFRGLILSLANTTLITPPDTTVALYSCEFSIPIDATGMIPLANSNCGASDPAGGALETNCVGGSITVDQGPEPPSVTMTPTDGTPPPPRPTSTARTRKPTATRHGDPGNFDDDDDACQVAASSGSHLGWVILAPAALLVLRRRRD
jgi:hypothetical protein